MSQILYNPYLTIEEEQYQMLAKERRDRYVPQWILQRRKAWLERDSEVCGSVFGTTDK